MIEKNFTITIQGQKKQFVCADQCAYILSLAILKDETYQLKKTMQYLKQDVKIILDIGANMGAFSVLSSFIYPKSKIFSFEPGKTAFQFLRYNTDHISNINTFFFGLSQGESNCSLYTSGFGTVGASIGKSNINSSTIKEEITIRDARQILFEHSIEEIDILKIDTEGCEVKILSSLNDMIEKIKLIYIEYHSESDRRILDTALAATHYLFFGKIEHPHRGKFCYLRQDLVKEQWDHFKILV